MKGENNGRFFAFGVKRSPDWFFFEIDEREKLPKLLKAVQNCHFFPRNWEIRATLNGYHLIAYSKYEELWENELWKYFKRRFKTNFHSPHKKTPQILRLSAKYDANGEIISPAPVVIFKKGKLPEFKIENMLIYRGFKK